MVMTQMNVHEAKTHLSKLLDQAIAGDGGGQPREHPHLRENILSAMGNIKHDRLLDTRWLDTESAPATEPELLPVLEDA